MKRKDWSKWKVACSGISQIMSRPRNAKPLTKNEQDKLNALILKTEPTDKEYAALEKLFAKDERSRNYELSSVAISYLTRRYAWEKYNKRLPQSGWQGSAVEKGNLLELEAIDILSKLDAKKYEKTNEKTENDYMIGVCDVIHPSKKKIIDVKTSWNINTFLPYQTRPIELSYWFQMQGYMELYDADEAEVCFVLVDTPPHLIEREREKITTRYMIGEINRDKYDDYMDSLSHAFTYNQIPIKRRVIRHVVPRFREIVKVIYGRVDKSRVWLNEFEDIHTKNQKIVLPADYYVKNQSKQDNSDADAGDFREGDEG
jgi:hypothetical protein